MVPLHSLARETRLSWLAERCARPAERQGAAQAQVGARREARDGARRSGAKIRKGERGRPRRVRWGDAWQVLATPFRHCSGASFLARTKRMSGSHKLDSQKIVSEVPRDLPLEALTQAQALADCRSPAL
eukprot:3616848-Pleurochrysis_carterae.AAC.1